MPIWENCCVKEGCCKRHVPFEWYAHNRNVPDPNCEECGDATKRMISVFRAPWTGTIDRFDVPGKEDPNKIDGGHVAWRVRSTRNADGSPEPVRITTRQEQLAFCRAEGLEDPAYAPSDPVVSSDGKSISPMGMPGVWH